MDGLAWRLETFDLRAGLAFATYRAARQPGGHEARGIADWPCVHFSPPAFDPQPVDNVALALAASRGSFDSGLLVGDVEAGFKELADVAEFVRRAYVASAGGDGSDAPGGPQVPPPPPPPQWPEGPDAPPFLDDEDIEASQAFGLRRLMQDFNTEAARRRAPGASDAMAFKAPWASGLAEAAAQAAMARGARHLLAELLDRCPEPCDDESLWRWDEDLRRLGILALRCGVFLALVEGSRPVMTRRIRSVIKRLCGHEWNPDLLTGIDAVTLLLDGARLLRRYPLYFWGPRGHDLRHFRKVSTAEVDLVDTLERWPAPGCTQALAPRDHAGRCSALALLSAVTSAPEALSPLSPEGVQVALDVAVFCSACLTSASDTVHGFEYEWLDDRPWQAAHARTCADRAMAWLADQLPRLGFRIELEQRISSARHLTYGTTTPAVA